MNFRRLYELKKEDLGKEKKRIEAAIKNPPPGSSISALNHALSVINDRIKELANK